MLKKLIYLGFLWSGPVFAAHPGEGSEKLPDLINEALSNNPAIKSRVEFQGAGQELISAARGSLAPELSITGGRKAEGGGSEPAASSNFAQLDANWNLYRGGTDTARIHAAEAEAEVLAKDLQAKKLEIASSVANIFFELQYVGESLDHIERVIAVTRTGRDTAKRRFATGQTSGTDTLEFEIFENKLRSQQAVTLAEQGTLVQKMRSLLGRPENRPIRVGGHLARSTWAVTSDELKKGALTGNPELAIAKLKVDQAQWELKTTGAGFLPTVDFNTSWGKLADSDRDQEKPTWAAQLKVTVPLFSGLSTARERDAKSRQKRGYELAAASSVQVMESEIADLLGRLKSIEQRLTLEENNAVQAEKYLKLTQKEYARGVKNSPDVASAMDLVLASHLHNLELRREWQLTKMKLQSITGTLPSAA